MEPRDCEEEKKRESQMGMDATEEKGKSGKTNSDLLLGRNELLLELLLLLNKSLESFDLSGRKGGVKEESAR